MTREVSRQAFLRGALGAAAGGVLGSCRPAGAPDPETASPVSGPQDWRGLGDAIEGHVILPSSTEYGAAKNLFNSRFVNSTPAAVVTVKSTDDVQKAVAVAAKSSIKIAPVAAGTPTSELRRQTAPWSSTYGNCLPASPTTKAAGS